MMSACGLLILRARASEGCSIVIINELVQLVLSVFDGLALCGCICRGGGDPSRQDRQACGGGQLRSIVVDVMIAVGLVRRV